MDRTELFKAVVKTVRLRLRAQRKDNGSLNEMLFQKQANKEPTEFGKLAKNTVSKKYWKLKHQLLLLLS